MEVIRPDICTLDLERPLRSLFIQLFNNRNKSASLAFPAALESKPPNPSLVICLEIKQTFE